MRGKGEALNEKNQGDADLGGDFGAKEAAARGQLRKKPGQQKGEGQGQCEPVLTPDFAHGACLTGRKYFCTTENGWLANKSAKHAMAEEIQLTRSARRPFFGSLNILLLALVFLGSAFIQVFIGGMRPIFAIPGYTIIALAGVASVFLLRKNRPLPSVLCMVSSILFFSYILARTWLSPVEYLARHDRYMVLGCLVVYFIFALYVTEPKHRLWFLYGLFALAVGHVIIGAIQFSQDNNYLPFGYLRANYGVRASGFYVCPNHYAGLVEMLAIVALSIGIWGRVGVKTRMLILYMVPVLVFGLALSGSRGGYLSVAVAFVTFTILSLVVMKSVRPERFMLMGSLALVILFAGGLAGVTLLKKNVFLASRVDAIMDTSNMRIYLWESAWKQFLTEPATGTGAGTYAYLARIYRNPKVQSDPVWVHNDYYHLLAEYGYLGAIGCALFVGAHLWHGLAAARTIVRRRMLETQERTSTALALNLGSIAAIAAILAHSVVDFNAHIVGNALVLAMLFGFLANPPTQRVKKDDPNPRRQPYFRLLIPACSLVLLVGATPQIPGEWFAEKSRVALRDGRYLEAMREAKKSIEWQKDNPNAHFQLGEARRLLGNTMSNEIARAKMNEAALVAFTDSTKIYPQDVRVWVRKSQALDLLGRHDEAFQHLEKARELEPVLYALNMYYGAHFQLQGKDQEALEYYSLAPAEEIARKERQEVLRQIKDDSAR